MIDHLPLSWFTAIVLKTSIILLSGEQCSKFLRLMTASVVTGFPSRKLSGSTVVLGFAASKSMAAFCALVFTRTNKQAGLASVSSGIWC